MPVLVSTELSEKLSGLSGPDDQIFVDSMHVPIPGVETGHQVLELRLTLLGSDADTLITRVRGVVREVSAKYRLYYRCYLK